MVYTVYNDRKLFTDIVDELKPQVGKLTDLEGKVLKLGERIADLSLSVVAYSLYMMASYPYNAIFFLYWQRVVTVVAFLVIPSIIAFWALYHAMGNRNFFATNPAAYKGITIAEGLSDDEDDDDYDDEEYGSESESDSEGEPLQRHRGHRQKSESEITVIQADRGNQREFRNRV